MPITTETVTITPELAAHWLATANVHNRHPRPKKIDGFARDMAAELWMQTGEAIKFTHDRAVLLDGQNRLAAIVKAGVPVTMLIATGIEKKAQAVMDTATPRAASDALAMADVKNSTMTAALARTALSWKAGQIRNSKSPLTLVTHSEVIDLVATDPHIEAATDLGQRMGRRKSKPMMPTCSAIAAFYWIAATAGAPVDDICEFIGDLAVGRSEGLGDPRSAVIQRLASAVTSNEKMPSITQTYLLVRGWNAMRSQSPLKRIQVTNGEGRPLAFPVALP